MNNNLFKNLSLSIIHTWLLLFGAIPVILILVLCFFSTNDSNIFSLPLTFDNFKLLLNPFFYKIVWRSMLMAFISTIICFVIAYPFSYFLSKTKHKQVLLLLILIPFWTSSLIRTYALIGLLKTHGLINNFLLYTHLIEQPLDLLYNQTAVLIGLSYNLLPFMILPLFNTFNKFDETIISAAEDLNASRLFIFQKIIWPLSIPGVKSSMLLIFFPAMTTFYIPTILGGAKSMLLGNLIENQFLLLNDWPGGATTSIAILFVMFLLIKLSNFKRQYHE